MPRSTMCSIGQCLIMAHVTMSGRDVQLRERAAEGQIQTVHIIRVSDSPPHLCAHMEASTMSSRCRLCASQTFLRPSIRAKRNCLTRASVVEVPTQYSKVHSILPQNLHDAARDTCSEA